ncbi:phosphoribosylformylglycinamidine synthase [Clostridium sp.]|uniref:phosphoribosylformylglycinamidine synthase n=1 Tax=Clostridium sp. TaxID=1506 RepID=UPI0034642602
MVVVNKVIYVEKIPDLNIEGEKLKEDIIENLNIRLDEVRIINRYIISNLNDEMLELSSRTIFSEKTVDNLYKDSINLEGYKAFVVEYLKGQYDQRADAAMQCIELLTMGNTCNVSCSKIIAIKNIETEDLKRVKEYYINPVDSKEGSLNFLEEEEEILKREDIGPIEGFTNMNKEEIINLHKNLSLAMTLEDLNLCNEYFKKENRNPTLTEIKVIDTYWSDHCRHTTFFTSINNIEIEEGSLSEPITIGLEEYKKSRNYVYNKDNRDITLMDIATIAGKELKKRGLLKGLDESDEINACTIKANIETDNGIEEYLILFKNETHNHPTEIEPFGGAATCLGGAIRDPLSGRAYVYQAMRITGSGDPRIPIEKTLKGKLPQRVITKGAAKGYSSYGNQIGLATGFVEEIYHEGFIAKRMEIGAVIGSVPRKNVKRETPSNKDVIILIGGRTGRDGCGGATGSSKGHDEDSVVKSGAEVQKGNAPTERKLQRFFRNKMVSTMIKKCNDFGAGGVSVAIGELADGVDIYLDLVPKKYGGLNGLEIAISESQERMAVVVDNKDYERFISLALEENLEATKVGEVTSLNRVRMFFEKETIVDIDREFLNTNGAKIYREAFIKAPREEENYFNINIYSGDFKEDVRKVLTDINICSKKGLVENFDSTIGSNTVLMPFGGKYQLTPIEGMASKVDVFKGESKDATLMTFGYNPYISSFSPFHGGLYAVIESASRIVAMGGKYSKIYLTFQEYFEKLGEDKEKWGKPLSALLGALYAQKKLGIAAIGGKDSMSGTFENLNVPPTLVSFAMALEKAKNIISPEIKKHNTLLVNLQIEKDHMGMIDFHKFSNMLNKASDLIENKKILSAFSLRHGGLIEGICKMSFGNKIGVIINEEIKEELFKEGYGSLLIEIDKEDLGLLEDIDYRIIGSTTKEEAIIYKENYMNLNELINLWTSPMEDIFPIEDKKSKGIFNEELINKGELNENIQRYSIGIKKPKPRVVIPVFPGTNCEWDSTRAFEREGAEIKEVLFKNINKHLLRESVEALSKEIKNSEILMLSGGFSAGDEPDGSGKFIATAFRNPYLKEAVMELLNKRDGLILGICNGFQALIKLGLVPYGEIVDIEKDMATLTYNTIGRHVSSIVKTKVVSKLSPWYSEVNINDIHNTVVSHGEGRFVAPETLVKNLIKNGQVSTQYVDSKGRMDLNIPHNPNGSIYGIEGITSPCGRVLGKMGHSERIGENLYKNIEGNFDDKIFKSGVSYFTK